MLKKGMKFYLPKLEGYPELKIIQKKKESLRQ
jgi:hypothetical protein